jgi:hypothetical protein
VSNVTPTRWYIDTRGHASDAAFSQVSRSETEVGGIDAVTLTPGRLIELPPIVTNVLHPEAPARVTELANAAAVMPRPLISSKSWPPAGFASKSVMISWPNPAEKKKTSSPAPPFNVSFALPSVRTLARALLSCWARSGEPLTEAPCGVEDPSRARRRTTGRQPRCRPKSPRRRCWRQCLPGPRKRQPNAWRHMEFQPAARWRGFHSHWPYGTGRANCSEQISRIVSVIAHHQRTRADRYFAAVHRAAHVTL